MENQEDTKRGKKEGRSPGYPAIDLETALERARQIKEEDQRHFAPIDAVMKHWGYTSRSGPVQTTWSALIKFGLLEVRGTGSERQGRITDLAWRILIDNREESPARLKAIQEAALNPVIHQKLWDRYEGNLPSDETFRIHLLRDYKFTEGAVKDFIGEFKRTIAFANIKKPDNLIGHEEDKPDFNEEQSMPAMPDIKPEHASPPPPSSPRIREPQVSGLVQEFNMALSDGKTAYLRIPHVLKRGDWEKIRKLLDVIEPADDED